MAHRAVIQAAIIAGRSLGRAFAESYRHAQASSQFARAQAKAGTGTGTAGGGVGSMTLQEACQILNVKPPKGGQGDIEEVMSRFKTLFDANDPQKGGSFYLQSKILRARERLEHELRPMMEKAEQEAEIREGWKPNIYNNQPKERPKDL
ncbi:mitochondrial import inner membrane translocase subunit tim-16 [Magnaporthiopsis poae ATCC 64411]|uniref:Mitochondrial import inner membrane translocase subunit TIM16 n=1 Tax=Magnaporthiopsis poae (strain ATCC 64411 / 73-15) TaxID=644358 RepID=A0A0C4DMQ1_MAGP6|nr:mitochondrial import inner membrane translocase subunit tim-16 [Magnaporthiopsis poae ATCC 64411]